MTRYMPVVGGLNAAVNFLLLAGANRICGYPPHLRRTIPAALLCALHAMWCLIPGFYFLGNGFWHMVFAVLTGLAAFGMENGSVRRLGVYLLLQMIFTGITLEQKEPVTALFGAAGLFLVCLLGMGGKGGGLVPVELRLGDRTVQVTALRDTGNTLCDPLTGSPVLVVGAQVANRLADLSSWQLKHPVETMGAIPGLRLIPYNTIDRPGAMMLGMRLKHIRIGSWKGSGLVAFAPEQLSHNGQYEALTGGAL